MIIWTAFLVGLRVHISEIFAYVAKELNVLNALFDRKLVHPVNFTVQNLQRKEYTHAVRGNFIW